MTTNHKIINTLWELKDEKKKFQGIIKDISHALEHETNPDRIKLHRDDIAGFEREIKILDTKIKRFQPLARYHKTSDHPDRIRKDKER